MSGTFFLSAFDFFFLASYNLCNLRNLFGLKYFVLIGLTFLSIQVDSLKIALKHLRNENIRLKSQHMKVWWPVHLTFSSYYYKYTQPSVSLEW